MRGGNTTKSFFVWVLYFLAGAIIGGLIGEMIAGSQALSGLAPYLVKKYVLLDIPPVNLNLFIAQIKFGLTLQPNFVSVLGVVVAMYLCRRL